MIMILFGALSAGTKTYLLCRPDRHAFTSTFCNTLPVGCLNSVLAWKYVLQFGLLPFPFKMIELKALLFPV